MLVLNRISRRREEKKREKRALKVSLGKAGAEVAREQESLFIVSGIAEAALLRNDVEAAEDGVRTFIEEILNPDLYLLLILDKRKKDPIMLSKNVSPALLGEISRAARGNNIAGPFEGDSVRLKGVRLFDLNEILSAFFAAQKTIDNLSSEDVSWLNLVTKLFLLADKGRELDLRTEKLAVTEEAAKRFSFKLFKKQLEAEWQRAQRYNRRLSLILLDLDDFKIYQERFGLEQKESTLTEIAQMLRDLCRRSDIVSCYAGDELAVILPETDVSGAFIAAERIRETISREEFLGKEGKRDARLTASMGVASYPLNTADQEGLLREVESALYKAKVTGRNRVCGPELPA